MRAGRGGIVALAASVVLGAASPAGADPAADADPLVGTIAPGFTVPGAATPFGMVVNSPDTRGPFAYSGYSWTDPLLEGFSLVHLSGPGVKKAGDLPFMPVLGDPRGGGDPTLGASPLDHALERAEPGFYRAAVTAAATTVELTASTRAAMQRYRFPPARVSLVADASRSVEGPGEGRFAITGPDAIEGARLGRYPVFFSARFSRPFDRSGTFVAAGPGAGGWVGWDAGRGERTITMRVGISFTSVEGARRNLEAEAPDFDFDGMRAAAREAWNRALGRIRVEGGSALDRRTFTTALYHSLLHPNVFADADGAYLGFDGKVHRPRAGHLQHANFSSWDTYKSQNQLLALLEPARTRQLVRSLLADAREGGRMPRWGEQNLDAGHMSGDPAIPLVVDATCRGLITKRDALAAFRAGTALVRAREPQLAALGYLPLEASTRAAGTTLEYGVADFALALLADALGRRGDARRLARASLRYRHLLDPETRFVRPRFADGRWLDPFDPTEERGFQEGNSWHYSWLAMHDGAGLVDAFGGDAATRDRLATMFRLPPAVAAYTNVFGLVYRTSQFAPGNEHDLQIPWMAAFAGAPWQGAKALADVRAAFRPTPDGLPGNDDLGGLSAWHVWSALGIGPVIPGAPIYVIGSPQFARAVIDLGGGRTLEIRAPGAGPSRPYVVGAMLNGRTLDRAWVRHDELARGGVLELAVASSPDPSWGADPAVRPPSLSTARSLREFGCRPAWG